MVTIFQLREKRNDLMRRDFYFLLCIFLQLFFVKGNESFKERMIEKCEKSARTNDAAHFSSYPSSFLRFPHLLTQLASSLRREEICRKEIRIYPLTVDCLIKEKNLEKENEDLFLPVFLIQEYE